MLCALDASTADRSLYDAAITKSGVQNNPNNEQPVDIGPSSFDQTDLLGGGQCMSDFVITVAGNPITIAMSNICSHLSMFGNVLLAVTLLLCIRIVSRG